MKNVIILFALTSILNGLRADDFGFKTKLDSVPRNGYYKVALSPEIVSASKPDYSDIRIFDSRHNEIPYVLVLEQPATQRTGFKEYNVLENEYLPKQAITRIVVHNASKNIISSLILIVRNSEVEKEITLKGSDNQQDWYIIKKNFPVATEASQGETSRTMILDFPKSNYQFFELTMNDKKKDPLQVIKVGYYDSEFAKGLYTETPAPVMKQADSVKVHKSYISIKFNQPYEISKLNFIVKGPELYLRNCIVGRYAAVHNKLIFEEIGRFVLSSKSQPELEFSKIKTDGITIIIDNSDNPPLQLVSLKTFQLNKYLIANLKSNEIYHLFVGQTKLSAPEYDLKYFSDSLPASLTVIKTARLISIGKPSIHGKTTIFNSTFLWAVIILIIALLAWFSIKLTRELGKEKQSG